MSLDVMTVVWKKAPVQGGKLLLLLALADNANDEGIAYPGIKYLARKARMTSRNVQFCLRELADAGLMKIIPNGGKHGTNEYRLQLDVLHRTGEDFLPTTKLKGGENISPPETAEKGGENISSPPEAHFTGGVKNDAQGGEAHFTLTVIEPSEKPSDAHECARESDPEVDRKAIKRAFQSLVNGWPGFAGMSLEGAWKAFLALKPEEQNEAAEKKDRWMKLLRDQGKDHTPAPSTYFREKLWKAVADFGSEPETASQLAAPFGKAWMAHVLGLLKEAPVAPPPPPAFLKKLIDEGGEQGIRAARDRRASFGWPKVNRIFESAGSGQGCRVDGTVTQTLPEMEALAVDSRSFDEWRVAFFEAGFPWMTVPDQVQFVWFPVGGPGAWFNPPPSLGPSHDPTPVRAGTTPGFC